jgi:16S rRNA C967 or C1407 C5-methylase (RsmB/RsmF family)
VVTPEGYVRTFPHHHGTDAFFAARLRLCLS